MKAKRQAERIACGSNMRQIVIGLVAYSNDHKGFVPAPAVAGTAFVRDADWVHWQPTRNLEESRVWVHRQERQGPAVPRRRDVTVRLRVQLCIECDVCRAAPGTAPGDCGSLGR
jgi:hypothetical protein